MLIGKTQNNAYMHVFVNTTSIKKYEKEKATNKWLHIMFSSISHEFRTPLNAFINAVELIDLSFSQLQTNYKLLGIEDQELQNKNAKFTQLLEKNIQTARISSKTLLSLIEDILDFAKK